MYMYDVYMCVYVCMYVCVYVYVCIYVCIYVCVSSAGKAPNNCIQYSQGKTALTTWHTLFILLTCAMYKRVLTGLMTSTPS